MVLNAELLVTYVAGMPSKVEWVFGRAVSRLLVSALLLLLLLNMELSFLMKRI